MGNRAANSLTKRYNISYRTSSKGYEDRSVACFRNSLLADDIAVSYIDRICFRADLKALPVKSNYKSMFSLMKGTHGHFFGIREEFRIPGVVIKRGHTKFLYVDMFLLNPYVPVRSVLQAAIEHLIQIELLGIDKIEDINNLLQLFSVVEVETRWDLGAPQFAVIKNLIGPSYKRTTRRYSVDLTPWERRYVNNYLIKTYHKAKSFVRFEIVIYRQMLDDLNCSIHSIDFSPETLVEFLKPKHLSVLNRTRKGNKMSKPLNMYLVSNIESSVSLKMRAAQLGLSPELVMENIKLGHKEKTL